MIKFSPSDNVASNPAQRPYTMVSGQNDRMAGSVPVWSEGAIFAENIADAGADKAHDKSFGFADLVDIINPLQHIPIVSNLYQSATGDTIGSIAQIVGGALFGGPIGALASAGMVAYHSAKEQEGQTNVNFFEGTTIAVADLRQGYTPYNS